MATTFAQPNDVATLLKVTFTVEENAQCAMILAGVSAMIRSTLPIIDSWISQGLTDPELTKFCAIEMARQFINVVESRGLRQETMPEHTVVFRDFSISDLELTESWITLLTPPANRAARGTAFSIRPG